MVAAVSRATVTAQEARCAVCDDTGEASGDGMLDCRAPGCNAAITRAELNRRMSFALHMSPADRDWAVFQYAQKQVLAEGVLRDGVATDAKAMFESWAGEDGTYDLRPYKWTVISVGGVPYDGYRRPYQTDRTVYTYEGFAAGVAAARAVPQPAAAPSGDVEHGLYSELLRIQIAMEHMGDQLNNMDVVEEDDEKLVTPGFDALNRLLAITATKE